MWSSEARVRHGLLGALLGALPLAVAPFAAEPFEAIKLAIAVAIALALWVHAAWTGALPRLSSHWVRAAVALLASALLSTFFSSHWPSSVWGGPDSLAGLGFVGVAVTLLVFTRDLPPLGAWHWAVVTSAALAAGYGAVQWLGVDPFQWSRTATWCDVVRPFSTLGHPNSLAGYLAMASPLAVTAGLGAWRDRRPLLAGFAAMTVVGAGIVTAITYSRGGWLALAAGLSVVTVGLLRAGLPGLRFRLIWVAPFLAGGAVLALQSDAFRARLGGLFSAGPRRFIYRAAWEIFAEHPWLGSGLDTFQLAFQAHRRPEYWAVEWGATPQRAHSDFLQLLATQGMVGALVGLACILLTLRLLWRGWRDSSPSQRAHAAGLAGCLAAAAVHASVGFHVISTAALAAVALGQLGRWDGVPPVAPTANDSARPALGKGKGVPALAFAVAVTAVAALVAFWLVFQPLAASIATRRGLELEGVRPERALASFERAVAFAPWADTGWTRLAAAAQRADRASVSASRDFSALAAEAFTRALELSPGNAYHHANWGRFVGRAQRDLSVEDKRAKSAQAYDAALRIDPNNAAIAIDALETAMLLGDRARGQQLAERLLARYPRLGAAWLWLGVIARSEGRTDEAQAFFTNAAAGYWPNDAHGRQVSREQLRLILRERGVPEPPESNADGEELLLPTSNLSACSPS